MKRFAKTVVKVLTAYADLLKNDFPNHLKDERTVSTGPNSPGAVSRRANYMAQAVNKAANIVAGL
jgi:hypothetical protein